jgi:hypothetical protein
MISISGILFEVNAGYVFRLASRIEFQVLASVEKLVHRNTRSVEHSTPP